ncbi:MAG: substrate-binding domain-containing protein [Phycisphaerae bacterium]
MVKNSSKQKISRRIVEKLAGDLAQLGTSEVKPLKLPAERELAKKFILSRRAIRLAIGLLETRDLVERRHGSGNYLLPKKFSLNAAYLVIPPDIKADDIFYNSMVGRLTLYARAHQINLLPIQMDKNILLNKEMPGILPAGVSSEQVKELTSALRSVVAMVDLNSDICCQIFFDDYGIGQEAARRIAELGHRDSLMLTGPGCQRVEGFRAQAMREGLGVVVYEGEMNWRGGYELMKEYLNKAEAERTASAVFASNDWMAAGAMQAIVQAGLNVPEDFSLVGCDNVPLASELVPSLSTFHLDPALLVEQTFLTLEQTWRLQLPKKIILPARFIPRESLSSFRHRPA